MAGISAEETVILGTGLHLVEPGVLIAIIQMPCKVPAPSIVQVLWSMLSATYWICCPGVQSDISLPCATTAKHCIKENVFQLKVFTLHLQWITTVSDYVVMTLNHRH